MRANLRCISVYISKYSDCLDFSPWYQGKSGYIAILRLTKGRVKAVMENYTQKFTAPSPGFDCHISEQISAVSSTTSSFLAYERTQYYLYEPCGQGEGTTVCPRHALPFVIVAFSYGETKPCTSVLQEKSSAAKAVFHYHPWRGQLQIQSQVYHVAMRSNTGALIPAQLPAMLTVERVIRVSDLRKRLPQGIFETCFTSEVSLEGRFCNLYEVVTSAAEDTSLPLLTRELKEKELALVLQLNDFGLLILLHSSYFLMYEDPLSEVRETLLAMFVFPDSRALQKETKMLRSKSSLSPDVLQVLPGLNYAETEAGKCPPNQQGALCDRMEQRLQSYAALIQPGMPDSPSGFPDQYDIPEMLNHLYSVPKCREVALQRLQAYLGQPEAYILPVARVIELLAVGQEEQGNDADDDVYYCLSSPEAFPSTPASFYGDRAGVEGETGLDGGAEGVTSQQQAGENEAATTAEVSQSSVPEDFGTPDTVALTCAKPPMEVMVSPTTPMSGDLPTDHITGSGGVFASGPMAEHITESGSEKSAYNAIIAESSDKMGDLLFEIGHLAGGEISLTAGVKPPTSRRRGSRRGRKRKKVSHFADHKGLGRDAQSVDHRDIAKLHPPKKKGFGYGLKTIITDCGRVFVPHGTEILPKELASLTEMSRALNSKCAEEKKKSKSDSSTANELRTVDISCGNSEWGRTRLRKNSPRRLDLNKSSLHPDHLIQLLKSQAPTSTVVEQAKLKPFKKQLRSRITEGTKENGWLNSDTPFSHDSETIGQLQSQGLTPDGHQVGPGGVSRVSESGPTGACQPADALTLLADLALSAQSFSLKANASVKERKRLVKRKLPLRSPTSKGLVVSGEVILVISKEHSYSLPPSCMLLGLTGGPHQLSLQNVVETSPSSQREPLQHTDKNGVTPVCQEKGSKQEMTNQPSPCDLPAWHPATEGHEWGSSCTRHVVQVGETIHVTRLWKDKYEFDHDSKYTSDPLDKSVLRALHGRWDFTIEETFEQAHLILHMWIGLFYSRSTTRFFPIDPNGPVLLVRPPAKEAQGDSQVRGAASAGSPGSDALGHPSEEHTCTTFSLPAPPLPSLEPEVLDLREESKKAAEPFLPCSRVLDLSPKRSEALDLSVVSENREACPHKSTQKNPAKTSVTPVHKPTPRRYTPYPYTYSQFIHKDHRAIVDNISDEASEQGDDCSSSCHEDDVDDSCDSGGPGTGNPLKNNAAYIQLCEHTANVFVSKEKVFNETHRGATLVKDGNILFKGALQLIDRERDQRTCRRKGRTPYIHPCRFTNISHRATESLQPVAATHDDSIKGIIDKGVHDGKDLSKDKEHGTFDGKDVSNGKECTPVHDGNDYSKVEESTEWNYLRKDEEDTLHSENDFSKDEEHTTLQNVSDEEHTAVHDGNDFSKVEHTAVRDGNDFSKDEECTAVHDGNDEHPAMHDGNDLIKGVEHTAVHDGNDFSKDEEHMTLQDVSNGKECTPVHDGNDYSKVEESTEWNYLRKDEEDTLHSENDFSKDEEHTTLQDVSDEEHTAVHDGNYSSKGVGHTAVHDGNNFSKDEEHMTLQDVSDEEQTAVHDGNDSSNGVGHIAVHHGNNFSKDEEHMTLQDVSDEEHTAVHDGNDSSKGVEHTAVHDGNDFSKDEEHMTLQDVSNGKECTPVHDGNDYSKVEESTEWNYLRKDEEDTLHSENDFSKDEEHTTLQDVSDEEHTAVHDGNDSSKVEEHTAVHDGYDSSKDEKHTTLQDVSDEEHTAVHDGTDFSKDEECTAVRDGNDSSKDEKRTTYDGNDSSKVEEHTAVHDGNDFSKGEERTAVHDGNDEHPAMHDGNDSSKGVEHTAVHDGNDFSKGEEHTAVHDGNDEHSAVHDGNDSSKGEHTAVHDGNDFSKDEEYTAVRDGNDFSKGEECTAVHDGNDKHPAMHDGNDLIKGEEHTAVCDFNEMHDRSAGQEEMPTAMLGGGDAVNSEIHTSLYDRNNLSKVCHSEKSTIENRSPTPTQDELPYDHSLHLNSSHSGTRTALSDASSLNSEEITSRSPTPTQDELPCDHEPYCFNGCSQVDPVGSNREVVSAVYLQQSGNETCPSRLQKSTRRSVYTLEKPFSCTNPTSDHILENSHEPHPNCKNEPNSNSGTASADVTLCVVPTLISTEVLGSHSHDELCTNFTHTPNEKSSAMSKQNGLPQEQPFPDSLPRNHNANSPSKPTESSQSPPHSDHRLCHNSSLVSIADPQYTSILGSRDGSQCSHHEPATVTAEDALCNESTLVPNTIDSAKLDLQPCQSSPSPHIEYGPTEISMSNSASNNTPSEDVPHQGPETFEDSPQQSIRTCSDNKDGNTARLLYSDNEIIPDGTHHLLKPDLELCQHVTSSQNKYYSSDDSLHSLHKPCSDGKDLPADNAQYNASKPFSLSEYSSTVDSMLRSLRREHEAMKTSSPTGSFQRGYQNRKSRSSHVSKRSPPAHDSRRPHTRSGSPVIAARPRKNDKRQGGGHISLALERERMESPMGMEWSSHSAANYTAARDLRKWLVQRGDEDEGEEEGYNILVDRESVSSGSLSGDVRGDGDAAQSPVGDHIGNSASNQLWCKQEVDEVLIHRKAELCTEFLSRSPDEYDEMDEVLDYSKAGQISLGSDQSKGLGRSRASCSVPHVEKDAEEMDWISYCKGGKKSVSQNCVRIKKESDEGPAIRPSSIITVLDNKGNRKTYENYPITKTVSNEHTRTIHNTSKGSGHLHGFFQKWEELHHAQPDLTQSSLDLEYLIFSEKMSQILKKNQQKANPSSSARYPWRKHAPSDRTSSPCGSPMTVQFSELEDCVSEDPRGTPIALSRRRIKVDVPEGVGLRTSEANTSLRPAVSETPLHLKRLSYTSSVAEPCPTVSNITVECARSCQAMISNVCSGRKLLHRPDRLKNESSSQPYRSDFCRQLKEAMCGSPHNNLRQSFKVKFRFYILVTSADAFFEQTKTLLETEGHVSVEPDRFDLEGCGSSTPLLIILRNEDIADHISTIPRLLELKKTPSVLFAGVDWPDDVLNLTHQELFSRGGTAEGEPQLSVETRLELLVAMESR
ncbi:hypothetical protein AAFF_G00172580 [Aldrovandia affinis]|uniref:DUF3715 domain-containing protein n=1 Tax=Aldrovandia affinis TaxID=143900 RepID=A0AAD7WVY1_9TELE|nr:hypothetical protein AAFF_G00172580 [Aldrovandia affinis]